MTTILVSAGDLSGERHAAELVRVLRSRRPDLRFVGMGGAAMSAAGVEIVVDQHELAVGGFFGWVRNGRRIWRAWRRLLRCLEATRPEVVVLVDSGGFNLRFAGQVRRRSRAKIFYYIAPQIWAWRPGRLRALRARTDRIGVILPFERDFYAARGVEVDYIGHPLLDGSAADAESVGRAEPAATSRRLVPEAEGRAQAARARLALPLASPLLGLFPGSRRNEIARHLDLMIGVFRGLRRDQADLEAVLVRAPTLDAEDFSRRVRAASGDLAEAVHIIDGESLDAFEAVDVALAKPGTITLELLLHGCPMVVVGRVDRITAWIVRRTLSTRFFSMPNLLANEEIVPERMQEEARVDAIVADLTRLFSGPGRSEQLAQLAAVRAKLGSADAAQHGARIVEELLEPGTA